jgi:hypothetical protein
MVAHPLLRQRLRHKPLSRLRERKGPAAEGGGKVRVFFLLFGFGRTEEERRPSPNPLPQAGEGFRRAGGMAEGLDALPQAGEFCIDKAA